jgi:hypothetical protein
VQTDVSQCTTNYWQPDLLDCILLCQMEAPFMLMMSSDTTARKLNNMKSFGNPLEEYREKARSNVF